MDRRTSCEWLASVRSVFFPVTLAEAQKAIAVYDLRRLGLELLPIPAEGGCVIAIRELPQTETYFLRIRLPWVGRLKQVRAEAQLRLVLRSLAVASATKPARANGFPD